MKKTLMNKLFAAGVAGLASFMPLEKAEAQVSGSAEYVQSENSESSYARANAFYSLSKGINGFTFMELYRNGSGYFGKTYLDKKNSKGIGPRVMAVHAGEPLSEVGMGVNAVVPHLPKNVFATVGLLPLWIGNDGKSVGDKAMAQYFVSADLPLGLNLSSFGDLDILADGGPQWDYGEVKLQRNFGPVFVGYNPVLLNDGDTIPRLEHRGIIGVNF